MDLQSRNIQMKSRAFMIILRTIFGALVALLTLVTSYAALWHFYQVEWHIKVDDVHIRDTVVGEPVYVEVARVLNGTFMGGYKVTIRKQPEGYVYCGTGNIDVRYREFNVEGGPTLLPDPIKLSYWAEGGSCTSRLRETLPASLYSVETCHYVTNPLNVLPRKTKCWPISVFRVFENKGAFMNKAPEG